MIVSRCPIDVYIGVKNHHLNALLSPTKPKGFSSWLCRGGAKYFANGTYGLHAVPNKTFNKMRDAFICFSGPVGGHAPPSARGIVFKLINTDGLEKLKNKDDAGHDRIVRLIRRNLVEKETGKKTNSGQSPAVASRPVGVDDGSMGDGCCIDFLSAADSEVDDDAHSPGLWRNNSKKYLYLLWNLRSTNTSAGLAISWLYPMIRGAICW